MSRSSSREVRIRLPFFSSVVYFSRGTTRPQKRAQGHRWGTQSVLPRREGERTGFQEGATGFGEAEGGLK